ncbi:hypothetical protein A2617_03600 [Candidatus Daviesbacteria bacterium RIFOXYD1_FULL_41_10]|uniref:Thioredoxin-like fold domain-containing protein n=1 Tax=Candidatus Daviesbacteria bacterium RIFOXYD1_FULL_41_10 TaxID=1797801 RepID=A0A1F5N0U2_9BACT|nr:MAG: hypothetical protein A2617_03600 [Candidatus Daviesbacteria bacterium RIFOXYD1_FULL_41_10]
MDLPKYSKGITSPIAILVGSVIIAVAILISGGVIQITPKNATVAPTPSSADGGSRQAPSAITLTQVKDAFSRAQIKFGDANRKLIVLEISDPSCPYCHIAAGKNPELNREAGAQFKLVTDGGTYIAPVPELKKLVDSGQASLAWIYSVGHGNGEMGTKAMYCANEKGKFWEVHDLLMTSKGYDLLNNTVKNDKAKSGDVANFLAGVFDSSAMKACLDSGKYDNRLQTDVGLAQGLGVSGTPGFFLNATPFSGAYSFKDMETAVTSALK